MNRIALAIKEARLKAKLTEKALAKKCGLTESYIIQVESGKKVINEQAAEKILKVLGQTSDVLLQEPPKEAPAAPPVVKTKVERESIAPVEPTESWEGALGNLIKKFPITSLSGNKVMGAKELPIIGKKIEGYPWDRISFVMVDNSEAAALRIHQGDVVMVVEVKEIQNQCIYLFQWNNKRMIRQLRKEQNNRIALYTGVKGETPVLVEENQVKIIGKCVKVEFSLG